MFESIDPGTTLLAITSAVSAVIAAVTAGLAFRTIRIQGRQAESMNSSAVVDVTRVCLTYFDYEFMKAAADKEGHTTLRNVKQFRQHWFPVAVNDKNKFRDSFQNDPTMTIGRGLYEMSYQLNRLGVAAMISRDVLDYTLALHANVILRDFHLLHIFLEDGVHQPPRRRDRRAVYWLAETCSMYMRVKLRDDYQEKLPAALRDVLESQTFSEELNRFREIDGVLIAPAVARRIRTLGESRFRLRLRSRPNSSARL